MSLKTQTQKVYDYIKTHPGCTTRDIINDTSITYPMNRIAEMRKAGVSILKIGTKKYHGAKPFKMYAINQPSLHTPTIPGLLAA